MAKITINVGSVANDGSGDTLRGAFINVNSNFTEVYSDVSNNANDISDLTASLAGIDLSQFISTNNAYFTANAAFIKANSANLMAYSANGWSNAVGSSANSYASILAANNAVGANAWANTVGTAGNNYASILAANNAVGANVWANTVSTAANNYASILVANNAIGANGWANTVGTAGNNYTNSIGIAGNNYTNSVGTSGNNYTIAVGAASNNYSNSTFVKLTACGSVQTITSDIAITGNLTFLGNSTIISSNNLSVGDSLIYLAANNYSGTDLLDIGFVANYGNTTGANVHTGLVRDATNKQYYLFNGLDIELSDNNTAFTGYANGAVNAILNADLVAGNVTVAGLNVYSWVSSAFTVANSSNGWANTVGTAGNNYTISVGTAGNNYTDTVGTAGNNYTISVGAAANTWANTKLANTSTTIAGNLTSTGAFIDSKGDVRDLPINNQSSSYTLSIQDTGKIISITTGNVFVMPAVFYSGNAVSVYNNSSANVTITENTSVTLNWAGTANTGNRILQQKGFATIVCVAANTFVVSGAGML